MTANEKAKAKTEQAGGAAAQAIGRAVGNESLTAKGHALQMKGDAREAKEKTKDIGKH
ncbi:CsbD family protein [Streptomyces durmitorensis]|uniref:CsbD family protein n=1 Tax=Streptomyces durmitorensis TaxID=319947 RepID=A0ABY4Q4R0_9ACTN|nr:CsbD family protein [Streptomyces durmitorensis]UQT61052.1 CsbD family protein [Streptomyces durmitorensis]